MRAAQAVPVGERSGGAGPPRDGAMPEAGRTPRRAPRRRRKRGRATAGGAGANARKRGTADRAAAGTRLTWRLSDSSGALFVGGGFGSGGQSSWPRPAPPRRLRLRTASLGGAGGSAGPQRPVTAAGGRGGLCLAAGRRAAVRDAKTGVLRRNEEGGGAAQNARFWLWQLGGLLALRRFCLMRFETSAW